MDFKLNLGTIVVAVSGLLGQKKDLAKPKRSHRDHAPMFAI